jgi:hypothetical protein
MKFRIALGMAAVALLLGGCASAPQMPLQLNTAEVVKKDTRIGVAMSTLPKVDTEFPGAGCLLCLATASVANNALTTHIRTLPYEDLPKLKEDVAALLRRKGSQVTVLAEDFNLDALPSFNGTGPNVAKKDFTALRDRYKLDKLLVIEIGGVGVTRAYSGYIPTSDPKAQLRGLGYLVNLSTNTYEWYQPVVVQKSADKAWDEPPSFPGLTNAYFQALELGKDEFTKPFVR